jgi:flagellar secretion chaperone FliS
MNPRLSYQQATAQGASPLRLVILLYDQAIADLQSALSALACGDIESRTRHINHAILVIGHLEASLDKDKGGPVAMNLERFYRQLRSGLLAAQIRQSAAALQQQLIDLLEVRQAWEQVDRQNAAPVAARSASAPQASSKAEVSSGWNA